jgi:hypothetical protein
MSEEQNKKVTITAIIVRAKEALKDKYKKHQQLYQTRMYKRLPDNNLSSYKQSRERYFAKLYGVKVIVDFEVSNNSVPFETDPVAKNKSLIVIKK